LNKKCFAIFIILVQIVNITGCWDSQDINNMCFPIAGAYDLHKGSTDLVEMPCSMKNQNFIDVTTLSPNLSPEAKTRIRVETVAAPTTGFARDRRPLESGHVYMPALVQAIVIGEDLAKLGLMPYLDALLRAPLINTTVNFAIADGRGEDILLTPVDDFTNTGTLLRKLLRKASSRNFVPDTTLHDFTTATVSGKNPVLPIISKSFPVQQFSIRIR